jgi:hypothetical protein
MQLRAAESGRLLVGALSNDILRWNQQTGEWDVGATPPSIFWGASAAPAIAASRGLAPFVSAPAVVGSFELFVPYAFSITRLIGWWLNGLAVDSLTFRLLVSGLLVHSVTMPAGTGGNTVVTSATVRVDIPANTRFRVEVLQSGTEAQAALQAWTTWI